MLQRPRRGAATTQAHGETFSRKAIDTGNARKLQLDFSRNFPGKNIILCLKEHLTHHVVKITPLIFHSIPADKHSGGHRHAL
jgi:hypothetical protein